MREVAMQEGETVARLLTNVVRQHYAFADHVTKIKTRVWNNLVPDDYGK